MPLPSARRAAIAAAADLRRRRRLDERPMRGLTGRDAALAHELRMGLARRWLTLRAVLSAFLAEPWDRLDGRVADVLAVGAYQIIWLTRVPDYVAVNEAVEHAKRAVSRRAAGLVNAVLRAVLRSLTGDLVPLAGADPSRCVPVDVSRGRRFDVPVLPDPATDRLGWLSAATSHPRERVERWARQFGAARAESICAADQTQPPIFLRPDPRRHTTSSLCDALRAEGVDATVAADGFSVCLPAEANPHELSVVQSAGAQPQDPTSIAVGRLTAARPGERVLDLCAGVGTKTFQMVEMMDDAGVVLAADRDGGRLDALRRRAGRTGCTSVRVVDAGAVPAAVGGLTGPLDLILIDAPCSNSGVFARRPEARYRLDRPSLERLVGVQSGLLGQAADLATPTTRVVYSTCSIEPAENEHVIEGFLQSHPRWRADPPMAVCPAVPPRPAAWRDGGFATTLRRIDATD